MLIVYMHSDREESWFKITILPLAYFEIEFKTHLYSIHFYFIFPSGFHKVD